MILKNRINEAAASSYPKAISDYVWKISETGYYMCLNFDKESVGKTYPFNCTTKGSLSIGNREYIYFLRKEDAEKFLRDKLHLTHSNYNIYLSKDKTKAVRVDDNGDIPVYADELYIKVCLSMKLKSKLIPDYIKENLEGPFITNTFLSNSTDAKVKRKLSKDQQKFNLSMTNIKTIVDWADSNNYQHSDITNIYDTSTLINSFYVCVPLADIASKHSITLPSVIYKYLYIYARDASNSRIDIYIKASNLEPGVVSLTALYKEKAHLSKEFNYSCSPSEKVLLEKSIEFFMLHTGYEYSDTWRALAPTDMIVKVAATNEYESKGIKFFVRASYDWNKKPKFILFDMTKENITMQVINDMYYPGYSGTEANNLLYFSKKEPITISYIENTLEKQLVDAYGLKMSESDIVKTLTDMWLVLDNSLKPKKVKVDKTTGELIW